MFSKILIANRGEIACRVIQTCKRMGIATVAVYSDADARAPFVKMADEAVHIGAAPAAESYLLADKIIEACKQTGAEAVHPGYGFLSERASFVEALDKEGIVFIGPPAKAIAAMGDKIESKKLAKEAGVNTVPGSKDAIDTTEEALKISNEIGYPVMMKASAGGGGKGMRLAWNDKDVEEGFEATKREGLNSFGDDRVFIEKFIEDPRHIEIQILADRQGNTLYLNERECSIQRRHQKVVEEAPSPFVTPEMRKAMGEQAVALSQAVGYFSAGTVELIVSGADKTGESFYFLEMNTRLQVEHPVTEAITGVDLVEWMIRVAAGEELPFKQDDIKIDGWSIETRVYAEDPYRNFLPSIGRLVRYEPPVPGWTGASGPAGRRGHEMGGGGIRVDDGVFEGGEVSIFYDPMIAKLITWGPTRDAAADLQVEALDAFRVEGPGHNIDFLSAIMQHPRFRSGELTTGFIAEEYPDGFQGAAVDEPRLKLVAALIAGAQCSVMAHEGQISGRLDGAPKVPSDWVVKIDGRQFDVVLGEGGATVDGEWITGTTDWQPGMVLAAANGNGENLAIQLRRESSAIWALTTRGKTHKGLAVPARLAPLLDHMIEKEPPDLSKMLICPMPGLLVKLHVAEGDEVQPGQPLATVEAMKMENILRAEKEGTISSINAAEGDSLAVDEVILELE
ncbi:MULTISPECIES: acetyl-CoA carboxylase biotin carboxylase subunit [Citromicrobium]|uniref:acetyl-CoA carboxylase biotin carboxylase subunit n=1 Tax=Citromicrobium TaxID=72173 RepID=UPI0001DD0A73|nr:MULTISPECIES: acetyl/propionyl/methylcrotonyl-CoA carboxylase subunit alpha [Citromicrobium]ALG61380.1 acetyl-CoA carboxylase [Citromicrobium sp. JL477]KPM12221.1 acetyl-CoA carboxylase [Citromicrobium sp. JL1351]KPM12997.1 acetyl-CoA carboxylase [Citromicrobium sp. JL31]KPM20797.1 acetyl-CoA carboxylase [Citromicrobium sp. JL2201]